MDNPLPQINNINSIKSKINLYLKNKTNFLVIGYLNGFSNYKYTIKFNVLRGNKLSAYKAPLKVRSYNQIKSIYCMDIQLKLLLYPMLVNVITAFKNCTINVLLNRNYIYIRNILYDCLSSKYNNSKNREEILRGLEADFNRDIKDIIASVDKRYQHRYTYYRYNKKKRRKEKKVGLNIFYMPIWIILNTVSLGHFGNFLSKLKPYIRCEIRALMNIKDNRYNYDFVRYILALKDLRNALAHNKIIFDCRFKLKNHITNSMYKRLGCQMKIDNINFNSIIDYFILLIYYQFHLSINRYIINDEVLHFDSIIKIFKLNENKSTINNILGLDNKIKLKQLNNFIV